MHNQDRRRLDPNALGWCIALALSAAPGIALAQDAAAEPDQRKPSATLETVTVTAQKRAEDERKVPAAISVVGEQQLESQHVTQLSDLNGYLPAMTIDDGGTPGQTSVSLRGIPTLGPSAVVAAYIDDTPLGSSGNLARSGAFLLDLLPYDIERVEVLRGPQGTLYGASAMGGLLKYVLKDPDLDAHEGRAGVGVSNVKGADGTGWNARASVNAPLIPGKLALRASFANEFTPGWVDNAFSGRKGINDTHQRSGLASVLWQPNDDVRLKVTALHQRIDADDNSLVTLDALTLQPSFGRDATGKPVRERFEKQVDYLAATLNWDLAWANFVSATSYSKTDLLQVNDLSKTYGPIIPLLLGEPEGRSVFPLTLGLKKWTQEFRLASKSEGPVEWMLGAFYTDERSTNHQSASAESLAGVPTVLDPLLVADLPSSYREHALFGNLTYKFSERFDVTAGLRYASNDQSFKQIISAGSLADVGVTPGASSEEVVTYLLGSRWHLSDDDMLYLRVASGYRPGGPNVALQDVPPTVDADSLVNYELGWKSLLLDGRASIDLAAYRIDWKDIQLSATTANGLSYLTNAGRARSEGVELTSAFKLTPNLLAGFNASYTNAKLLDNKAGPALGGRKGDHLPGVPKWTMAATADYNFALPAGMSGHIGGSYHWLGERKTNVDSNPRAVKLDSSGQLNLNADISKGRWTLRLYVRNLTDNRDYSSIGPVFDAVNGRRAPNEGLREWQAVRLQPRTVGLEFDVWF
ncbi:hypothetical protein ASE35_07645 [Lysobacter sp. Root916]|uniref:TonB-dependent receptor n=1 Tax=Lysobacter sp. Root916 TaxID=1736606 RepID=UPI00070D932B|nr:TonB-dependent receptor [Lysobacter sp. Root916]KRD34614.1 hypothetical protein ASE35_07645 [Lysobacter sp. Root916]